MSRQSPVMAERSTAKQAQREGWRATYQRCKREAVFARVRGDHKAAALLEERATVVLHKLATHP